MPETNSTTTTTTIPTTPTTPPLVVKDKSGTTEVSVAHQETGLLPPKSDDSGLILGKFKTPADLAKAYTELQKKLGEGKPAEQSTTPTTGESAAPTTLEVATPKPDEANNAFNKFNDEFAKTGKLSDDSYKELAEKHGISKTLVDQFIAGGKAAQNEAQSQVFSAVGGQESYSKITEWAKTGLTQVEREAYNKAVSSDVEQAKLAAQGLAQRYFTANGRDPKLLGGERSGASGIRPFTSTQEITKAMSDPRYWKDTAYQNEVRERIAASTSV